MVKKNIIRLFEWTNKKKIGSQADVNLSDKEITELQNFNDKLRTSQKLANDIIKFDFKEHEKFVSTFNYVGVLKVCRKTIQIIPKIADKKEQQGEQEYSRQAVKNLLYMLSYTKRLKVKETDVANLTKNNDDFFEILIYLFAKNLLELIRGNYHRDYVHLEDNLGYIKGKLLFSDHLKNNLVNQSRFYLSFDEFCEDTLLNQILKFTVHLLIKTTNNLNNLKLLQELNFIFADISLNRITTEDLKKVVLTRLNIAYEPILNLAKIFISNSSLELSADKINTFSFLFDMNVLFEEFVGEFLKQANTNYRVSLQRPIKYFVKNKIKNSQDLGPVFMLRPDIQLYNQDQETPEIIIDTKYKILDQSDKKEGVSQSDLYQMNAYAQKYQCQNIILLYPRLTGQEIRDVQFQIDDNRSVYIRTIDLCRDLKSEKEVMRRELIEMINLN